MMAVTKRRRFLGLFLLFLSHEYASAVRINTIEPACIADTQVRLVSKPVKCPCFARVQMQQPSRNDDDSALRLDFLAVRASDYDETTAFDGLKRYEKASGTDATTDGRGTYNSGDVEVNDEGHYIFLIRTRPPKNGKKDCATTIRYVFESVPEPCSRFKTTGNELVRKKGLRHHIVGGRITDGTDRIVVSAAVIMTKFGDCSAVAVSQFYLLTAAHCRVSVGTVVRVGGRNTQDTIRGTNHIVRKIWVHPDYRNHAVSGLAVADVAVLRVDEPMDNIDGYIEINANEDNGRVENQRVEAAGYGRIAEGWSGAIGSARDLKTVQLQVFAGTECMDAFKFGGAPRVAEGIQGYSHICAGVRQRSCRADTCTGDSGGPLIALNTNADNSKKLTLLAITSGGLGCGRIGIPGIYTRISTYAEWIANVTEGAVKLTYDEPPPAINIPISDDDERTRGSGKLRPWPWLVAAIAASAGVLVLALTLVLFFICYRGGKEVQTEFNGVSRDGGEGEEGEAYRGRRREGDEGNGGEEVATRDTAATTGRKSTGGLDSEV